MSDNGAASPFQNFTAPLGQDMFGKMWEMMRAAPFPMPGAAAFAPSLSTMSDMVAPLTDVDEMDRRITDLRAVEQWLKLNLSTLQSAIQALEVQRATLATLKAFGAFAQSSMDGAARAANSTAPGDAAAAPDQPGAAAPFDASVWWDMLQSQFQQVAGLASAAQPAAAPSAAQPAAKPTAKPAPKPRAKSAGASARAPKS